jgi:hypothetical protein
MKTSENLAMLSPEELEKIAAEIARGQVFNFGQSDQRVVDPVSYDELVRQRRARLNNPRG